MVKLGKILIPVLTMVSMVSAFFPQEAIVFDPIGKPIRLKDLKVGQKVVSFDLKGNILNDTVISISRAEPNVTKAFIKLSYEDKKSKKFRSFHISPKHLFLKGPTGVISVHAKKVKPGDKIIIFWKGFTNVLLKEVARVEGAYSPVTESGRILVDGVLVSCYEDLPSHGASHQLFQLYRKYTKEWTRLTALLDRKWGSKSLWKIGLDWLHQYYERKSGGGNEDL
jgi:hypothetical protein